MSTFSIEELENRRLFSVTLANYAQLVGQDKIASEFPSLTGQGITIADIDTGINYNLPQLGGGFGPGFKVEAGYDFYDNDSDPMDVDGHGTDTAFVMAGNPFTSNGVTYQGVAPDAHLIALRVGTETDISDDNIEKALDWVITNHAKYGIDIVNLSLGSGNYTSAQTNAQLSPDFATLKSLGIFVTAASGNSNDQESGPITQDGIAYPAADPNVFAVGAVDATDTITTWTQRGTELDLLAPGVSIGMPTLTGTFTTEDGTSFASPYVAGAAALIKEEDPTANAGDIGSILMSSGTENRDGDTETGNTTGLLFSRLNIPAALTLAKQEVGVTDTLATGRVFDTALDPEGVLHAVFYDPTQGGRLLYATRATDGLWSKSQIIDDSADVGSQLSIAVDTSGKVAIGYFDDTNTAIKEATFSGTSWTIQTLESSKNVGTSPSIGFDSDGNIYLAYYRRSGGTLRLAIEDRDTGTWTRQTVDGGSGINAGSDLSLDVGIRETRPQFGFTQFDNTVAIAYYDSTDKALKYARLDVDDGSPWFYSTVETGTPVASIDLKLHNGPQEVGTQAQIAYQDTSTADVDYAFLFGDWTIEPVATTGKLGDTVSLFFDQNDTPMVTYFDRVKKALFAATRQSSDDWTSKRTASSSGPMQIALNDRTGDAFLTWLDRPKTDASSTEII